MKKWIVFGAGGFGREVYYHYGKENIAYYVDNNLDKVGELFFGKDIISFKQYCKIFRQYNTVIAVRNYQPIERQLLEKGITEYTIYLNQREKNLSMDKEDDYRKYLYTPTYITKINDLYFIVDCWHHRIIYSQNLERPISEWKTLDDTLSGPHSISSDGDVYIADDTDHGEVCVYKREGGFFTKTQTIYGLGFRPHKCVYDNQKKRFYVLLSESCEIVLLKNNHGNVEVESILKMEIDAYYARSIQVIDDKLFLVCRTGYICELRLDISGAEITNQYKIPDEYAGINDIIKVGCNYYLSVYTDLKGTYVSRIVRTSKLGDWQQLEDMTEKLGIKGVPYYFSVINGRYYLTEIDNYSGISSFSFDGNDLSDRKELFSFHEIHNCSLVRRFGAESPYDLDVIKSTNIAIGLLKNIGNRTSRLEKNKISEITAFYIGHERENLISWYPFRNGSSVLEIVSECGSVSSILCEKCRTVTSMVSNKRSAEMVRSLCRGYDNIEICVNSMPAGRKFDYILAINLSIEALDRLLRHSQQYLAEDGKMIAVINNRLSESYWNSRKWKMPFREEQVFRKEIESVCKKWNKQCLFYYPLPDWVRCEMVCPDFSDVLSDSDILERIYFSKSIHNPALMQLIENHAIPSMAKSFFLEISNAGKRDLLFRATASEGIVDFCNDDSSTVI